MIFHEKKNQIYIFLKIYKRLKLFKNPTAITSEPHMLETWQLY